MIKKKYILWLAMVTCVIVCFTLYKYIYQEHRNVSEEEPAFSLTSQTINNEFLDNIELSDKKYSNKIIVLHGEVTEIHSNYITLDDNIFCQFKNLVPKNVKVNTPIYIKARYIGYDDLLEEIKLDQSSIINK